MYLPGTLICTSQLSSLHAYRTPQYSTLAVYIITHISPSLSSCSSHQLPQPSLSKILSPLSLSLYTMKKLIQRLSRGADSTNYSLLRSESRTSARSRRCNTLRILKSRQSGGVPEGHLPVYVGEESERFVVNAELLNHPVFMKLLNISAQEYGYEQKGVLRIPCHVLVFEKVLEAVRVNEVSPDVLQLLESF